MYSKKSGLLYTEAKGYYTPRHSLFYKVYRLYSTGFIGFILQDLQFLFYNLQFTVFFSLSQMQFELGTSLIYITLFTTILFLFLSVKN